MFPSKASSLLSSVRLTARPSFTRIQTMATDKAQQVRSTTASGSQVYESKRAVDEYLMFHYAQPNELFPYQEFPISFATSFTQRSAQLGVTALSKQTNSSSSSSPRRALDIGCAVGGLSFELARNFEQVVGIDFSHHFIDAANEMKAHGSKKYDRLEQGTIFSSQEAIVSTDIDRSRVTFQQGDACNLDPSLGKFDLIVASNLLCRLPNPRKFLADIPQFLNPNGILVLISPYSWLEEYTPLEAWIGARKADAPSAEVCKEILQSHAMQLVHEENVPFLIREHARKFQLGVSHGNLWRLK